MSEKKELNSDNLDQVAGGLKLPPMGPDHQIRPFLLTPEENEKLIKHFQELRKRKK